MLHASAFFISFAIGLLLVYLLTPVRQVIVKFPNPYGTTVYRHGNECFDYIAELVPCDGSIIDHPVVSEQSHRNN